MRRLIRWVFFGLLVTLFPILLESLGDLLYGETLDAENIVGDGQLLLITATIAVTGLSDYIEVTKRNIFSILVSFALVTSVIMTIGTYPLITRSDRYTVTVDTSFVVEFSLWAFFVVAVTTTAIHSMALAERKYRRATI